MPTSHDLWEDEFAAAAALKSIARNEEIKAYIEAEKPVHDALLGAAFRFIGGETLDACLQTARDINSRGHASTVDYMGESTRSKEQANAATEEFLEVIRSIREQGLQSSVSLDLSHIGLAVDRNLALDNATRLLRAAESVRIEIMVSMEGSERVDEVLGTYDILARNFENIGVTLQAYLHRTPKDLERFLDHPGKVRLVKGAFAEPEEISLPRGNDLNHAYALLVKRAVESSKPVSISTHDPALISHINDSLKDADLKNIEFEMLYGVCFERLESLRLSGYRTRIYLPYGREWFLYLCHRLAENPQNIYRALSDAVLYASRKRPM